MSVWREGMKASRYSLAAAYEAYWSANTPAAERVAYHQILFFGGKDPYRRDWAAAVARLLRRCALWIGC